MSYLCWKILIFHEYSKNIVTRILTIFSPIINIRKLYSNYDMYYNQLKCLWPSVSMSKFRLCVAQDAFYLEKKCYVLHLSVYQSSNLRKSTNSIIISAVLTKFILNYAKIYKKNIKL